MLYGIDLADEKKDQGMKYGENSMYIRKDAFNNKWNHMRHATSSLFNLLEERNRNSWNGVYFIFVVVFLLFPIRNGGKEGRKESLWSVWYKYCIITRSCYFVFCVSFHYTCCPLIRFFVWFFFVWREDLVRVTGVERSTCVWSTGTSQNLSMEVRI